VETLIPKEWEQKNKYAKSDHLKTRAKEIKDLVLHETSVLVLTGF